MTELQHSLLSGYRNQDESSNISAIVQNTQSEYRREEYPADVTNCEQLPYIELQNHTSPGRVNQSFMEFEQNDKDNHQNYKKYATRYKNDSGYSESIGFDNFNFARNERDTISPPPTPPVRDASSLTGVCYTPGHEKYPSWPSSNNDEAPHNDDYLGEKSSSSYISKSWTDQTNYSKERPAQYTRSLTKRPNTIFTQQLKTVMERCEKIPGDRSFESGQPSKRSVLWSHGDCEEKTLGGTECSIRSLPEKEKRESLKTLNQTDLEAYVRDFQGPHIECYQETSLTQTESLEEYTKVQHSQQPSYAQSEGYHSYVSSVDSTTTTPFLDRLRRDSETVAQKFISTWEDILHEGRDSVVTTSSGGSASSSETLKWHGSMSDVSLSSGLQVHQVISENGPQGSISDEGIVNTSIQKCNNSHEKWVDNNWQSAMNERNFRETKVAVNTITLSGLVNNCTFNNMMSPIPAKYNSAKFCDFGKNKNIPEPRASSHHQEDWNHDCIGETNQMNSCVRGSSKQLIAHSARVQTPQRHHSESILYLDKERNERKLYPISLARCQDKQIMMTPKIPSQMMNLSVAQRINELERQQQQQQQQQKLLLQSQQQNQEMRYTYLDPNKRHKVSDPTLKAIQKKALLSFYERHHQSSWRSEPQLVPGTRGAQSPAPQPPPRPKPTSFRRASSASDYANGNWRNKTNNSNKINTTELFNPKHQYSNSCGSLSTDLLGPVIIGSAISIDDWVPARPPKKPNLRSIFNDRLPSPDLPPPSPPTVTENEVFDCDDPLPPPPAEVHEGLYDISKENIQCGTRCSQPEERNSLIRLKGDVKKLSYIDNDNSINRTCLKPFNKEISNVRDSIDYAQNRVSLDGKSSHHNPLNQQLIMNTCVEPQKRPEQMNNVRLLLKSTDIMPRRYSNSGNPRAAPQVSIRSRLIRQESMRIETSKIKTESLTLGQRPQPQVPKNHSMPLIYQSCKNHDYSIQLNASKSSDYPTSSSESSYETNNSKISTNQITPHDYHQSRRDLSYYNQKDYHFSPPKYIDAPAISSKMSQPSSSKLPPPPLAPRQNKYSKKSLPPPPRPAPLSHTMRRSDSQISHSISKREFDGSNNDGRHNKDTTMSLSTIPSKELSIPYKREDPIVTSKTVTSHQRNYNYHHINNFCGLLKSHPAGAYHQQKETHMNTHQYNVIHPSLQTHEYSESLAPQNPSNTINVSDHESMNRSNIHLEKSNNNETICDNVNSSLSSSTNTNSFMASQLKEEFKNSTAINGSVNHDNYLVNGSNNTSGIGKISSKENEIADIGPVESLHDKNIFLGKCHLPMNNTTGVELLPTPEVNETPSTSSIKSEESQDNNNNRERVIKLLSELDSSIGNISSASNEIINDNESPKDNSITFSQESDDTLEVVVLNNSHNKVSSPTQTENSWLNPDVLPIQNIITTNTLMRTSSSSESSSSLLSSTSLSPQYSPCVSPQLGVEGLTLVQRTEVILRVNAATLDAASQTEIINIENSESKLSIDCDNVNTDLRKKLPEEIECEELSRNLVSQLGPNDKLVSILVPAAHYKRPTDYVSGLFRMEKTPQSRSQQRLVSCTSMIETDTEDEEKSETMSILEPSSPLSSTLVYSTISECRERFSNALSCETINDQLANNGQLLNASNSDAMDIRRKKKELAVSLDRKVIVLKAEQETVREEGEINEALGAKVATRISAVARPVEASKFRLHVEEIGKITSLLLGLSGRLARAENALHGMSTDHPERKILESKRDKLLEQLEEAKILKSNIDKRSLNIAAILSKYLNEEEFADYQHFINMKTKLIMDDRELQDKVKLGEEQLLALKEAIG